MAAGLGFKDFVTGEVLTAADVDGYLMQGVWVFASAAARDAAVTSPQEGNFAYLKDTNVTTYYTGSAWANLDTTGMTNPMTTTGDTIYSSSGSTPARLGIGTTGQVLTVAGGVPTWATAASGGGMTLLETLALTGSSVTSSTISGSYTNLYVLIKNYYSDNGSAISMRLNGDTGSNYFHYYIRNDNGTVSGATPVTGSDIGLSGASGTTSTYKELGYAEFTIPRYSATEYKAIFFNTYFGGAYKYFAIRYALWDNTAAITSLTIKCDGGNFSGGNAYIYGVK